MSAPLLPAKRTVSEGMYSLPVPFQTSRNEDKGWRDIGQNKSGRELPPVMQDLSIVNSFKAFRTNPMGKRLIEMQVNFVLGNGMSVNADDADILAEAFLWWTDPYNNWPARILRRMRDLYIYGEWLHRPLVDDQGFVRIADVQPDTIMSVVPDLLDHGICDAVIIKELEKSGVLVKNTPIATIRKRLRALPGGSVKLDDQFTGDLFYFGINQTTDSLRGVGELFTVLDYIDVYDDMLFSRAEKVKLNSQMFWDVTVAGMTETDLNEWLAKQTDLPPRAGSVFAHNEAITLQSVVPDLKSDDHSKDAGLLKSHIISTMGWPGTWFDEAGGAGRAVGAEMAEPALRNIVNLQGQVRHMISTELDYHLEMRAKKGFIKKPTTDGWGYTLSFNKPSARDIQRVGPALARLIDFVTKAHTDGLITQEEAREIVVSQANQLGISDAPLSMELPVELAKMAADKQAATTAMQDAALTAATNPVTPQAGARPFKTTPRAAGATKESQQVVQPRRPVTRVLWGSGTS